MAFDALSVLKGLYHAIFLFYFTAFNFWDGHVYMIKCHSCYTPPTPLHSAQCERRALLTGKMLSLISNRSLTVNLKCTKYLNEIVLY